MARRIYGGIRGSKDIRLINRKIRSDVRRVSSRPALVNLAKRSMYLYTLTFSPGWRDAYKGKISSMRRTAKREFTRTVRQINRKIPGKRLDSRIG